MKILKLQIENYKKIKAMHLEINGENLRVAGNTDQGKTTAISALWDALRVAGEPITHGEKKGLIKIVLGDSKQKVFVERKITPSSSTLSVITDGGEKISAREFGEWFCSLAINPHKILELKPQEQVKALVEAAEFSPGFLEDLDKKIEKQEENRVIAFRMMTAAKGKLPAVEPVKVEKVDLTSALVEYDKKLNLNSEISNKHNAINRLKEKINENEARIAEIKKENDEAAKKLIEIGATLEPHFDIAPLQEKIKNCQEINRQAEAYSNYQRQMEEFEKADLDHAMAEEAVKKLKEHKKISLESAKWPLPGISIESGGVYFNGVPLEQCGTSKQNLICGAIASSAIAKKVLRVVRMDGIESMSKDDFNALETLFNEKGIQVLSSRVARDDYEAGEIVINDGGVAEVKS